MRWGSSPCGPGATAELCSSFFFFQAEDGIRDPLVTGVQTCALPISSIRSLAMDAASVANDLMEAFNNSDWERFTALCSPDIIYEEKGSNRTTKGARSEERRVGKECRSRWAAHQEQKKSVNRVRNCK